MGFFGLIFVTLYASLQLKTSLITAQTYSYHFCLGGNYTRNSTFQANLNVLLASISSGITPNNTKFYTNSVGRESNRVYGLFQCRGDYEHEECLKFAGVSTEEIKSRCPFKTEAIIFYDECWLHYSYKSFISIVQLNHTVWSRYRENTSYPSQFSLMFPKLMNSLVAAAVSSPNLFAVDQVNLTISQRIYGLVQCTQDLNRTDCNTCLRQAVSDFSECCDTKIAGGVLKPSCIALYSNILFFRYKTTPKVSGPSPPPPSPLLAATPPNSSATSGQEKRSSHLVLIIVVPTVIVLLLISTIILFTRRSRKKQLHIAKKDVNVISNVHSLQLKFVTVVSATSNFCSSNKLGEGGFGSVYKGKLIDGRDIAVKRLSQNSVQGVEEFKNEVELLAKLQHRNLVKLLGFCVEGDEKILIYEFVSNGSLDHYIFDPIKSTVLDWEKRYRIIRGIARGLLYLHVDSRDNIIHRDLKASNVLLDEQMNPKISDFGMARLFMIDQTLGKTKRIVGTYGYMAPEYAIRGHFSVKSDVFSFGVLVLEIITGKKNSRYYESQGDKYLLSYAWKYLLEGIALELLEPQLRENCCEIQVLRCIQIGLLCVQGDAEKRPTMASISVMLNSNSVTIPSPSAPGFFVNTGTEFNMIPEESEISTTGSSLSTLQDQSTSSSRTRSINEVSISELHPR